MRNIHALLLSQCKRPSPSLAALRLGGLRFGFLAGLALGGALVHLLNGSLVYGGFVAESGETRARWGRGQEGEAK